MRRIAARAQQPQRSTQHGQLLLVMPVVIVIAFGAAYYALSSPTSAGIERDKITTAALAQVREALIGWSAARDPARVTVVPNAGEPGVSLKVGEIYERNSGEVHDSLGDGKITVVKPSRQAQPATRRGAAAKPPAAAR